MPPPPPPPPDPNPTQPTPIKAPVTLTQTNTLDSVSVITRHIWREYHWKAPTNVYKGETPDDTKVAELTKDDGTPIPKERLNAVFFESAIATIEADVPKGNELYMRWWLEDANGNQLAEHPSFSKDNLDKKNAKAKLATAKYAWRWDGRHKNANGKLVFLRDQPCKSMVEVKSKTRDIPAGANASASILVEGEPYKVWVLGEPKTDAQLDAEMKTRGNNRWLHTDGARLATDCWIKVFRGLTSTPSSPGDNGHMVFLGHGAIEATEFKDDKAGGVVKNGAIATPHDSLLRGWIRHRQFAFKSGPFNVTLCEIADVNPSSTDHQWLISLANNNPPANNPFCDSFTNQPFKDGVQGHRSFNQGGAFLVDDASTGCTTIFDTSGGTAAKPASVLGDQTADTSVFSIKASYGEWDGADPRPDGQKNKPWGPPLEGGRPGTFHNKQNKRDDPKDVTYPDDAGAPMNRPTKSVTDTAHIDEPLHMQYTFQHGLFGGFLTNEISFSKYDVPVPDEPDSTTDPAMADSRLRLRCLLKMAPESSKAWQYHRMPAFGHVVAGAGKKLTIELWVPRLVQRLWNGNWRNVLLSQGGTVNCDYAWFFEQRQQGTNTNKGYIGAKPKAGHTFTPLDDIGHFTKTVEPPKVSTADFASGAKLFSVFQYRIKLLPAPSATSVWATLPGRVDAFSGPVFFARLLDESPVQDGKDGYLTGQSELELPTPSPSGDYIIPTTPTNPTNPNAPATAPA